MKKIKIFFFFISLFLQSFSSQKYVIGTRPSGFFSNFFLVLMHLIGCKKNNLIPVVYWDHYNPYYVHNGNQYNNVWEYYFEPVSNLHYEKDDEMHRTYRYPGIPLIPWIMPKYKYVFAYDYRKNMNNIIREYVRIKKHISKKIELFFENYMKGKKVIGVHIRRTDKANETYPIGLDIFLKVVNKYKEYKILIASDEHSVIELFKKTFSERVIFYNAHRSFDSSPMHVGRDKANVLNAVIGEEVLIEAILLSRCDLFVHSVSNVATAVLFFNPELKNIFLDPSQHLTANHTKLLIENLSN